MNAYRNVLRAAKQSPNKQIEPLSEDKKTCSEQNVKMECQLSAVFLGIQSSSAPGLDIMHLKCRLHASLLPP